MQIVIMAGGMGTRLRPLTYEIPKPMVVVGGKPYLYYQLKYLQKFGYTDVLILIGYLGHYIQDYFKDGDDLGLNISYSIENEPLGTGGALKGAQSLLQEVFMLIYGDSFLPIDLKNLENSFNYSSMAGMVVVYDNRENTDVTSNIAVDAQDTILKYKKNSNDHDLNYVDAGISIFNKNVCDLIPDKKKKSLEEEIFPSLVEQRKLFAYITNQRFYDIGNIQRLSVFENYITNHPIM